MTAIRSNGDRLAMDGIGLVDRQRQRRRGDAIVLGAALAVAIWTAVLARRADPGAFEVNLFRLVDQLPPDVTTPLLAVMQIGALAAVPILAGLAVLARKRSLARHILLSGGVAWSAARLLQILVHQPPPDELLGNVVLHGVTAPGLAFPSTHVAVAASMASVIGPLLTRPGRRLAWLVVASAGLARIYVGAHLPIDIVGGAAVGVATAAIINLARGVSQRLPSIGEVEAALRISMNNVELRRTHRRGRALSFEADNPDGSIVAAHVVGRDQPDDDWLYRAARLVAFRDDRAGFSIGSPLARAEHAAWISRLACDAGIKVPEARSALPLSNGDAVLVTRRPHTVPLSELDPDRIDDALLDRVWSLATNLRHAGIAHRAMTADSVLVDEAGEPIVTDLWEARSHATTGALAHDAAMLCASIALAVGPDRSLAAAVRAIGSSSVGEVLPYLQPLQMNVETRRRFRSTPGLLATLRTSVAVHAQAPSGGIEAPVRVAARNLVPIVALAIAVQVLLPQVAKAGQISKVVQGAHWGWLLVVAAASAASYCMAAISLIGAAPIPLPPLRTIAVQLAAAFTNRIAPAGLGGMATNARYLERSGSGRLGAVSTVGLTSFAGFAVHLAAIGLLLPSLPNQGAKAPIIAAPEAPDYWPLLVAAILVLAILGILFGRRRIQMTLLPGVREAASSLAVVARSPGRLTALFAGSVGVTACYALALVGSVNAFGGGIPVTGVIGVYLAASAIASIAPTPGGLGALEAGLVAGLTTIHLAAGQAVAAVLAYRIITFWLPVAPGALAYRTLRARTVI